MGKLFDDERARRARHVCRKCGLVVEPQLRAHTVMRHHVEREHSFSLARFCNADCGFRARPSEGRYTETIVGPITQPRLEN